MKRLSKTLKSQNNVSYDYKGNICTIFNCTDARYYIDTGYYFSIDTNVTFEMKNKAYSSLSSCKRAFINFVNKGL